MRRVVVDTNVWVSSLLNPAGRPAEVVAALLAGRFRLVTSTPLLDELAEVLERPRIQRRHGLPPDDIRSYVDVLRRGADVVAVSGKLQICRDRDDDVVLETALLGNAELLVTRDEDLSRVPELAEALAPRGVSILTVRHFLDLLEADGDDRLGAG
ncbi:MAG TPA: putative toxin-antitoxin system toxin component, PIN family [Thermomicrobiales bacterium]